MLLYRIQDPGPGFRPDNLAVVKLDASRVRHASDEQLRTFYRSAIARVARLARVRAVSATSNLPVFSGGTPVHVAMPGEQAAPAERPAAKGTEYVSQVEGAS